MNRKTKLFFSLVSLCFSIAVLCFGVYSALSVSYSVSGSVSYEVTDAFVEITTNVYASSERMEQSTLNSNAQNLEDPTYDNTYTKVGETYTYNSMEKLSETNQPKASGIEINYNNYYTYFIVINIKNLSSDVNIYALIEEDIIGTELNSNIYKTRYQTGIIKPQTGDNVGKNIVLGFSLDDATIGVNTEFDYTLQVNAGEPQAAVIDVVALDTTSIVSNANFDGSSYTFEITSDSASHMTVFGCTTWLYNITLENIDIEYYNALLITVNTDQVIFGIGVFDRHITQGDDPLVFAAGISPNTDTLTSSINISSTTQQLCFGLATKDITGVHSTITLTFTNQIIDEENKLKFTQINNGTELSVSALDDEISGVVTIPSTYNGLPVTQIESGAASYFQGKHVDGFAYCNNITEVIIPETVREIAGLAFGSCGNLFLVGIQENSQLGTINRGAFEYCEKLVGIVIVKDNSDNIIDIGIPSSVTSIGAEAFRDCSALKTVTFGENSKLESIGDYAFRTCFKLTSIEIPSNVTSIGDSAFSNCSNLTSIEIPSSVTSIGDSAFYNCSALEKVNITNIDTWAMIDFGSVYSNPLYYGAGLYLNGGLVTEVTLTTATKISPYAFHIYDSLTSITILSSVKSIGDSAFSGCHDLATVTFEDADSVWVLDNTSNTEITISEHTAQELATYLTSTYYNYTWTKKQSA